MANDSQKHVETWLGKQGYPLEYRVARLLRAESAGRPDGLKVEQGRHWQDVDPRTGRRTGRELDVVATLAGDNAVVRVVVECKHLVDPWVIFEHEDGALATSWDETIELWMASPPIRQIFGVWYSGGPLEILKPPSGFKILDTRFDQKAEPEKTSAFDAAMQLARGAWALHQSTPRGKSALTLPVLVLEGDLFTVSYDSHGKERIDQVTQRRVTWSAAVLEGPKDSIRTWPIIITVVTASALEGFVNELGPAVREMHGVLEAKLPERPA